MNGFQLLTTRKQEEKVDTLRFENQFGFSLPPLYKLFISTFHLGEGSFGREMFLNSKRNEKYLLRTPIYYPLQDNERWFLSISHFETIEKVYENWASYLKNEIEWNEYGFLRISEIGQGGGLFIGTSTENVDQIFQVVWNNEEPYFKVTENIFELIKGFTMSNVNDILPDGYLKSQLFKKIDEDFWRVDNPI